jgi:hypothetical protein
MDNELLTIGSEERQFWYRYKPSQCNGRNGTVDRIAADAEAVPCEMGAMQFSEEGKTHLEVLIDVRSVQRMGTKRNSLDVCETVEASPKQHQNPTQHTPRR